MDVVTSYKCKLCSFVSENPEGVSGHIRSAHADQFAVKY